MLYSSGGSYTPISWLVCTHNENENSLITFHSIEYRCFSLICLMSMQGPFSSGIKLEILQRWVPTILKVNSEYQQECIKMDGLCNSNRSPQFGQNY